MKIGIIIGSLGFGGAERVAIILSEYWCLLNHTVCFFTTMKKPDQEYALAENIDRIECFAGNKASTIESLRKNLKKNRQDIVIIMDTPMCVIAVPALIGLHIPFIVSERSAPSTNLIKKSTKLLSHILMRFASGFVFQTNDARNYYSRGIRQRSIVIANPLNADRIPVPFKGERDKRVVAIGRLVQAKNYPCLIDAFSLVHSTHPDYSLEIYGAGELKEALDDYIHELNATEFIILKGASSNVLEDIRTAAAYVLSSSIEGMPNALIEAMAMGMPCISTDCPSGGPRELIENERNGLLVIVNDREGIADAINRVITNKQFAKILGENAEGIREKLDVTVVGNQWISFMEQVRSK